MASRGKSVPPRTFAPDSSNNSITELSNMTTPNSISTISAHTSAQPNKLTQHRAETLAKITFELNMRTVGSQMERFQRDLQNLVLVTGQDKEFREQHEARLTKLWQEMLVVKQEAAKVGAGQDLKVDFERVQQETAAVIDDFRKEIMDLKDLIDGISKRFDELPTMADVMNDSGYNSQPGDQAKDELPLTQRTDRQQSEHSYEGDVVHLGPVQKALISEGHDPRAVLDTSRRIVQAIKSTKRWNGDHKKSLHGDDVYCSNYLKQQAKRDRPLASYLQKRLLNLVRMRRQPSNSPPTTLEEFCKDIKWRDVIRMVQESLVKNERSAILALM